MLGRRFCVEAVDREWDLMAPVGREFGSPDYERLMELDNREHEAQMKEALKKTVLKESDFAKSALSSEVTPVGGNVFLDLGFSPVEAAVLKAESDEIVAQKLKSKKT